MERQNMSTPRGVHRWAATALAVAGVVTVAGCAVDAPIRPTSVGSPSFDVIAGQGIEVCKWGPDGTTATFSISASGGQLVVPATFTLPARSDRTCVDEQG